MTPAIEHTRAVWEYVPLADVRVVWEALSRGWRPLRKQVKHEEWLAIAALWCQGYVRLVNWPWSRYGRINVKVLVPLYTLPASAMKPWKEE